MSRPATKYVQEITTAAVLFLLFLFFTSELRAESLTLDSLANQLETPEALAQFMGRHFLYAEDQTIFHQDEYWQTPEEMLQRKQGDCEDYALFAEAILIRKGYRVSLFSVYGEEEAHTVAVFEKNGKWGVFDLDDIHFLKRGTIRELAHRVRQNWIYVGIMRREGNGGILLKKFDKQIEDGKDAIKKHVQGVYPFHAILPDNLFSRRGSSVDQQKFEIQEVIELDTPQGIDRNIPFESISFRLNFYTLVRK